MIKDFVFKFVNEMFLSFVYNGSYKLIDTTIDLTGTQEFRTATEYIDWVVDSIVEDVEEKSTRISKGIHRPQDLYFLVDNFQQNVNNIFDIKKMFFNLFPFLFFVYDDSVFLAFYRECLDICVEEQLFGGKNSVNTSPPVVEFPQTTTFSIVQQQPAIRAMMNTLSSPKQFVPQMTENEWVQTPTPRPFQFTPPDAPRRIPNPVLRRQVGEIVERDEEEAVKDLVEEFEENEEEPVETIQQKMEQLFGCKPTSTPLDTVQELSDNEELVQELSDNEEPVQELSDNEEPVQELSDNEEPVQELSDNEELVQELSDNKELVQELSDNEELVQELSDNEEPVQELSDNEEPVQELSDNKEPVQELSDNKEPVQELSDNEEPVQELSDNEELVQELSDNEELVQELSDNEEEMSDEAFADHLETQHKKDLLEMAKQIGCRYYSYHSKEELIDLILNNYKCLKYDNYRLCELMELAKELGLPFCDIPKAQLIQNIRAVHPDS
jgi:hypothetical protein